MKRKKKFLKSIINEGAITARRWQWWVVFAAWIERLTEAGQHLRYVIRTYNSLLYKCSKSKPCVDVLFVWTGKQLDVSHCCGCFQNLAVVAQCDSSEVLYLYLPQPLKSAPVSSEDRTYCPGSCGSIFQQYRNVFVDLSSPKEFDCGLGRVSRFRQKKKEKKNISHIFLRAEMFPRKWQEIFDTMGPCLGRVNLVGAVPYICH